MTAHLTIAVLLAWSIFGGGKPAETKPAEAKPEPAATPVVVKHEIDSQALQRAVSAEVTKAVGAAVSNAVEKTVKAAVGEAATAAATEAARVKAEREQDRVDEKAAKEQAKVAEKEARERAKEDREIASKAEAERRANEIEEMKRIQSRIFRLEHASAEEVAAKFNEMWSGEFGVNWKITKMAVAFPESNSLMITAPRAILDACEKSLAELDVEAQQVYIEARFVELGNSASHKVGIDWSMLDGMTGTVGLGGGIQHYNVGEGVTDYTRRSDVAQYAKESFSVSGSGNGKGYGSSDGSISYFDGTLSFSQMALTLSALDATEDVRTFSNPKIIVSSGKKATVDMTTKYPNVKISTKRTTGTSDSVDIASSLEAIPGEDKFMFAKEAFFSWGISLEVTPRISTNGLINVSIVPTISDIEDWVSTGTTSNDGEDSGTVSTKYPVIKVQRLVSEFNLQSGTTAVIGGLSITVEEQVDSGIPWLRDIPWVGQRIFGSKQRVKRQKEIVVFVTVGLVNPRSIREDAGLPKNAVLGRQYAEGRKLEPGDRPARNMEGFSSLDMRPLEEQELDPLRQKQREFRFRDYIPFTEGSKEK